MLFVNSVNRHHVRIVRGHFTYEEMLSIDFPSCDPDPLNIQTHCLIKNLKEIKEYEKQLSRHFITNKKLEKFSVEIDGCGRSNNSPSHHHPIFPSIFFHKPYTNSLPQLIPSWIKNTLPD